MSCTNPKDSDSEKAEVTSSVKPFQDPTIIHTVYFWMTKESTEADKKHFEDGLRKMATIESVSKFYWGPPANTPKRDVIDDSYDYALNVLFDNLESQDLYQTDPIHLEFIETYKHLWARVQVYDNLVSK